jgi:hydroxymethylpyrimidine/phosphomethylpyrimidine kinase
MQLPVGLTIAGSDNSAGAGIQADLKTMSALGVYGLTAVTCVVAEVPGKVTAIQAIEPGIVAEQVRLSFEAFPVSAIKTGMLYSREIISAVVEELRRAPRCPLVVDPVMVATSGDPLLREEAIALYRETLLPMATLAKETGVALLERFGCAFLVKGGHLKGSEATDILVQPGGEIAVFTAPFVPGVSTHGTGCTTSAAVAAGLAKGQSLKAAVAGAKEYVHRAIAEHLRWRTSTGTTDALRHFREATGAQA